MALAPGRDNAKDPRNRTKLEMATEAVRVMLLTVPKMPVTPAMVPVPVATPARPHRPPPPHTITIPENRTVNDTQI